TSEPAYLPLPTDLFVQRVIDAPDGSLWIGTSDGVLHYQSQKIPPVATVSLSLRELQLDASLPVNFGGMRRYAPTTPPTAFRYSWQFDDGAWTPFHADPAPELSVDRLSPGVH